MSNLPWFVSRNTCKLFGVPPEFEKIFESICCDSKTGCYLYKSENRNYILTESLKILTEHKIETLDEAPTVASTILKYSDNAELSMASELICGLFINIISKNADFKNYEPLLIVISKMDWIGYRILLHLWHFTYGRRTNLEYREEAGVTCLPNGNDLTITATHYRYNEIVRDDDVFNAFEQLVSVGLAARKTAGWFFAKQDYYSLSKTGWNLMKYCCVMKVSSDRCIHVYP